jgi:hypothetical protein
MMEGRTAAGSHLIAVMSKPVWVRPARARAGQVEGGDAERGEAADADDVYYPPALLAEIVDWDIQGVGGAASSRSFFGAASGAREPRQPVFGQRHAPVPPGARSAARPPRQAPPGHAGRHRSSSRGGGPGIFSFFRALFGLLAGGGAMGGSAVDELEGPGQAGRGGAQAPMTYSGPSRGKSARAFGADQRGPAMMGREHRADAPWLELRLHVPVPPLVAPKVARAEAAVAEPDRAALGSDARVAERDARVPPGASAALRALYDHFIKLRLVQVAQLYNASAMGEPSGTAADAAGGPSAVLAEGTAPDAVSGTSAVLADGTAADAASGTSAVLADGTAADAVSGTSAVLAEGTAADAASGTSAVAAEERRRAEDRAGEATTDSPPNVGGDSSTSGAAASAALAPQPVVAGDAQAPVLGSPASLAHSVAVPAEAGRVPTDTGLGERDEFASAGVAGAGPRSGADELQIRPATQQPTPHSEL